MAAVLRSRCELRQPAAFLGTFCAFTFGTHGALSTMKANQRRSVSGLGDLCPGLIDPFKLPILEVGHDRSFADALRIAGPAKLPGRADWTVCRYLSLCFRR